MFLQSFQVAVNDRKLNLITLPTNYALSKFLQETDLKEKAQQQVKYSEKTRKDN